jgi:hypothetical protein
MAPRTMLVKPWGFKKEVTWGTGVTVDTFYPVIDFEPDGGVEATDSDAVISGTLTQEAQYVGAGNESYKFKVGGECYDRNMDALFELMLGQLSTTGAGPYIHTSIPAEPLPSFTCQGAAPDSVAGTVRALTYAGSVCSSWEWNVEPGKRATWAMEATAKSETNATAAATLSYPAGLVPVHGQHTAVTLWGSAANIKQLKLAGDNATTYDERRFLGSAQIGARQVQQDRRKYTAELTMELEDNYVQYLRQKAQTLGAFVITVTVGSNTIVITMANARITEGHPKFSGKGIVEQPLKIEGLSSGATNAITIVSTNSVATP